MSEQSSDEARVKAWPRTVRGIADDSRIDDETLVSIAATGSNKVVALGAEIALRMRYPSKHAAARLDRGGKESER